MSSMPFQDDWSCGIEQQPRPDRCRADALQKPPPVGKAAKAYQKSTWPIPKRCRKRAGGLLVAAMNKSRSLTRQRPTHNGAILGIEQWRRRIEAKLDFADPCSPEQNQ